MLWIRLYLLIVEGQKLLEHCFLFLVPHFPICYVSIAVYLGDQIVDPYTFKTGSF